ncbi:hypothetical protein PPTG_23991 [Phytophthora nicotianae INRA-310]|uniref:Uncharacterized protein n=1 Tax=Phytophthora nicotianae (strain INRA-310) TaxID=761204 RepID=W2PPI4_PHYN3|nr:hypothetical protein PPTG_23991 [Phytophthora nicotianae INRA-310]ETN01925.1 hypothetical protein PPTG_23991 [Phytophthora nicotianae INRA-310]
MFCTVHAAAYVLHVNIFVNAIFSTRQREGASSVAHDVGVRATHGSSSSRSLLSGCWSWSSGCFGTGYHHSSLRSRLFSRPRWRGVLIRNDEPSHCGSGTR